MKFKWKTRKLGELVTFLSGGTPSKNNKDYWGGDIPWISASSMQSTRYHDSDLRVTALGSSNGTRLVPEGTVLLLVRGGALHNKIPVGITTREVTFNQDVKALIPKTTEITPYYLLSWLMSERALLLSKVENTGIGAGKLDTRILQDLDVLIPPKAELQRLESFSRALDDKIILTDRINQTFEQMAQALFKSWFVDFEPVKAKIAVLEAGGSQEDATLASMTAISGKDAVSLTVFEQEHPEKYAELRATAELFPSTMQESELGDIPAVWSSQRMSNIATLHYGKALKKTERIDGPYPVYGSGGVTGSHNGYLVEGPGIIVGRKGSIGTIYWEDGKFHPIDTVYYVATKEEIPLSYLYYLMKTLNLPSMNTDAAVPGLNRDNVYRLEVLKPTQSILNKFDNHIATIRNGIQKNNNTIVSLVGLRDTLLPKLLSGEISLPKAEELAKEADYV
ncbi:restriction endonuclease subunit S [Serratia liquefaciens]|uniref:restriction endonuclease subunit S n=1 Tax=Serratia liquefaciens TaxID=614 RepID=UPI0039B0CC61